MYVGGSNPVGQKRTYQSSGPRISYDYQAPVREFGTLGTVMQETKKYNYFMNDFGPSLAPAVVLPTSNQKREICSGRYARMEKVDICSVQIFCIAAIVRISRMYVSR